MGIPNKSTKKKKTQGECPCCNHGEQVTKTADCLLDLMYRQISCAERIESNAFKQYTSALKDLRDIKGIKHPFDREEQSLKLEGLRQKAETGNAPTEIRVVVEGGSEQWQQ